MLPKLRSFPALVSQSMWVPSVDVYKIPLGWLCKVDLAGVRPEDLRVELEDSRLRVSGLRRDIHREAGWQQHTLEIAYSRFERTVELPHEVAGADLETSYRQGMLLIRITTPRRAGR